MTRLLRWRGASAAGPRRTDHDQAPGPATTTLHLEHSDLVSSMLTSGLRFKREQTTRVGASSAAAAKGARSPPPHASTAGRMLTRHNVILSQATTVGLSSLDGRLVKGARALRFI